MAPPPLIDLQSLFEWLYSTC